MRPGRKSSKADVQSLPLMSALEGKWMAVLFVNATSAFCTIAQERVLFFFGTHAAEDIVTSQKSHLVEH